jgi:hypothetical protein
MTLRSLIGCYHVLRAIVIQKITDHTFFYFVFQFPQLKTIASRIVQVFLLFSVGDHSSTLQLESELDKESCEESVPDVGTSGVGKRLTSTRYH